MARLENVNKTPKLLLLRESDPASVTVLSATQGRAAKLFTNRIDSMSFEVHGIRASESSRSTP